MRPGGAPLRANRFPFQRSQEGEGASASSATHGHAVIPDDGVASAGCYGYQVDGLGPNSVIVFEAKPY